MLRSRPGIPAWEQGPTRNIWLAVVTVVLAGGLLPGCGSDDCAPNDHVLCRDGTTYWIDSCGNEGEKAEDCGCGCNSDYKILQDPL